MSTARTGFNFCTLNRKIVLRCERLRHLPFLVHGFSCRSFRNETHLLKILGLPVCRDGRGTGRSALPYISPRQVHGNRVIAIRDRRRKKRPAGDSLITKVPGIALILSYADCLPVLLVDEKNKAVGAVHAGWRGTAKHVCAKAVFKMKTAFETNPEHLLAVLFPCIKPCCYEVGGDVAKAIKSAYGDVSAFLSRKNSEKWTLDLAKACTKDLLDSGVREKNILTSSACTSCDYRHFYSYRRDGPNAGRMMLAVGIK